MRERGAHAPRGLALVPPVAVDRVDQEAGEVLEELETSVADVHRALQLVSVLAERVRQRGEDSTGAPAWRLVVRVVKTHATGLDVFLSERSGQRKRREGRGTAGGQRSGARGSRGPGPSAHRPALALAFLPVPVVAECFGRDEVFPATLSRTERDEAAVAIRRAGDV